MAAEARKWVAPEWLDREVDQVSLHIGSGGSLPDDMKKFPTLLPASCEQLRGYTEKLNGRTGLAHYGSTS